MSLIKIAPSLLSADFKNIEKEIKMAEEGGADFIHFDIMDGFFVPNITFGPLVVQALRPVTSLPFDVHLMIDRPERYVVDFVRAGADFITIHAESTTVLYRTIKQLKELGVKAGIALSPATSHLHLQYLLDELDLILIMTVEPGFAAQKFIPGMLTKIKETSNLINKTNHSILLEVDGGINQETAKLVCQAGANVLVAGNYLFGPNIDIKERIAALKNTESPPSA